MSEILFLVIEVVFVTTLSLILHLMLHEVGHMVGGLLSGYDFVFIRLGSFTILNDNGHIRFTRFSVPGTAGQCIMKPPSYDKFKFRLYFSGGILVNGLLMIMGMLCLKSSIELLNLLGFELIYMGVVFLLMNGLPLKMNGIVNDGYHIFKIKKDEIIKLYNQLMIGVLDIEGKTFNQMNQDLFICDMTHTSHFYDAYLILMNALLCIEREDISEAKIILDSIINDKKCIDLFKNTARMVMIILSFIEEGKECHIDHLLDNKLLKMIKMQKYDLCSLLCYYCLLLKDNHEAKTVEIQFLKQKDIVLEKGEVPLFMNLYNKIKKHY